MVNWGRINTHPLVRVEKVKTKEGRAVEIRALSDDEKLRLLAVADERQTLYLTAVHTGLRHSELGSLRWSDLHLDALRLFVRVRASTTKNRKAVDMRVHPELAELLRELKACGESDGDVTVFWKMSHIERFRHNLIKAGIKPADNMGGKAVFHPLRYTFGTNLARSGVASHVAMALMRHSDRRLTDKVYTDENLLGTLGAIDSLPSYADRSSQIAPQF